jgi:hypothetical protein
MVGNKLVSGTLPPYRSIGLLCIWRKKFYYKFCQQNMALDSYLKEVYNIIIL